MERKMNDRSRSGHAEKLDFALSTGAKVAGQYLGIVKLESAAILDSDGGIVLNAQLKRYLGTEAGNDINFDVYLFNKDVSASVGNNADDKFYQSDAMTNPEFTILNFDSSVNKRDTTDADTATEHIYTIQAKELVPASWKTNEEIKAIWAVFVTTEAITIDASEKYSLSISTAH